MFVSFVCWLALGAIVGFIIAKFFKAGDDDPRLGVAIAGAAAVVGGLVFRIMAKTPENWPGVIGLLIAGAAAATAVLIWHISRSASRA